MRPFDRITVLLVTALSMAVPVTAGDWPQFHGPKRDNISTETGLLKRWPEGGPKLLWTARGLGHGFSSISVKGGRIYTAGNMGDQTVVTALDLTGKTQWQMKCGGAWTRRGLYPGTRGTPTLDGDRLYYETPLGDVTCLDANSGNMVWGMNILSRFKGKNINWALSESLLIDDGRLICSPGGSEGGVVALDKRTGEVLWRCTTGDSAGYASPILAEYKGLRMIVTLTLKAMVGVDADSGKLLWRVEHLSYADENVLRPTYHDGHVFVSTVAAGTRKWRINVEGKTASVEEVWKSKQMDNHHGGVVLLDGYLYGSSCAFNRDKWICLDWQSGKMRYVDAGVGKGSLTVADGMLYILGERGSMGLVRPSPESHTVVSRFDLPKGGEGLWWAHPVVSDGRLYVRHGEFLYAYDVRAGTSGPRNDAPADAGPAGRRYIARGENTGSYWPTEGWRTCRPEAVGMNSVKLAATMEYTATPEYDTEGVVVIKDGYIVAEAYLGAFRRDSTHVSHSMAKSFTSALVGIAIDQKLIPGVDEKLCRYYDTWDGNDKDDLRSRITIRHALTLTSGLKWQEDWSKWDPATNDALKMGASGRFVKYMSDRAGLHEPGQRFTYSTGDPMLLSLVIRKASGMSALDYARKHLFGPLGIRGARWEEDKDGYTATAWGLHATVRDFAKFGYLYLKKGRWEDRQIVPEPWVAQSTRTDASVRMWDAYGYLWHVNLPVRLGARGSIIPADGYMAEGVLGQNTVVIPSRNLVIVKVADERDSHLDLARFVTMVLDSIAGDEAPGWRLLAPMPGERFEHGIAQLADTLYVFGGYAPGVKSSKQVRAFDPAGNTWRRLKDMPSAISHMNPVVDGRSVWIAGGFKDGYPGKAIDEAWRYDVDKDAFVAAPSLPEPRAGGGLALVGRRLHYFGGLKDRDADSADHWVLDLGAAGGAAKWTGAAAMPAPRNQFATVVREGKIWAIGGQFHHDSRNGKPALDQARVDIYDPATDSWSAGPALPMPHSHSENSAFLHDGRIFVIGGRSVNRAEDAVWALSAGKWTQFGKLPGPLVGPGARIIGGRLVVAGGAPRGYDPQSRVWALRLSQ